ncbi:uncharacterized beta-barrel protein YwiB (DUF1934 family) [Paenibacillus endophyticus]|uniref:Uncharacterized beta-barrel protein YwiB (DUF1934 family) n=1 Tax=Paenibacillus endophyticus TaxID=1294268 RepID=A0A7W5GD10_9BACL|nr:DUF1934 domain-containing protein [Paenibacillus endophyticus]MBB3155964.1 uncharacterized beta-barrel protein YwiB (DUF1934 family) [Paenibacillus endophyticus]
MAENRKVRITLESIQDGSSHIHVYEGEWFRKERSIFIRYIEPAVEGDPNAGEVRTLVKYRQGELSITRRGVIESEQLFVPGLRRTGKYHSSMTSFTLETDTLQLSLKEPDNSGKNDESLPDRLPFTLEWEYEMHVGQQKSGRFHIRLHIQEDKNQ